MRQSSDDLLDINCSCCGKPLRVQIADVGEARFVECESCGSRPPFNKRQVCVAFEHRDTDPAPSS